MLCIYFLYVVLEILNTYYNIYIYIYNYKCFFFGDRIFGHLSLFPPVREQILVIFNLIYHTFYIVFLIIGCHIDVQLDELHRFHTSIPQSEQPFMSKHKIFQGDIHEFTTVKTISKSLLFCFLGERLRQNLSYKKTLI